jgi:hypothetical protein
MGTDPSALQDARWVPTGAFEPGELALGRLVAGHADEMLWRVEEPGRLPHGPPARYAR